MTPEGIANPLAKVSKEAELKIVKQNEDIIRKTLQIGFERDDELDALIDQLALRDFNETYNRLRKNLLLGIHSPRIAVNNIFYIAMIVLFIRHSAISFL
jgi:hypothetical protein